MRLTKNPLRTRFKRPCPERPRTVFPRETVAISGPPPLPARLWSPGPSPLAFSPYDPPGSDPISMLQVRPGGLLDAAAGDQDEISGRAVRPAPVHLAQQTLGPGPLDGPSNLPACHHAEPRRPTSGHAGPPDGHEVGGNAAYSGGHHRPELGRPRNPLIPGKGLVPTTVHRPRAATRRAILTHFPLRQTGQTVSAHRTAGRRLGRQPSAAPATPASDDRATARSAHPCPETVLPLPPPPIGLKRPFHGIVLSKSLKIQ